MLQLINGTQPWLYWIGPGALPHSYGFCQASPAMSLIQLVSPLLHANLPFSEAVGDM